MPPEEPERAGHRSTHGRDALFFFSMTVDPLVCTMPRVPARVGAFVQDVYVYVAVSFSLVSTLFVLYTLLVDN
eukprot:scaffold24632_cov125-Isochrysis_galbana.AAC.2